ncbi:hypothetical protein D3C78_1868210 [compost metagenome]
MATSVRSFEVSFDVVSLIQFLMDILRGASADEQLHHIPDLFRPAKAVLANGDYPTYMQRRVCIR